MAIVPIPNIRDLGTVPNNNMEEPEYSAAAESFTGNMPGWGADNKAVGEAGRTNALHAESAAGSASSSADTANNRANAAAGSATTASTKAGEAVTAANQAAASFAAMQKLYLGPKAAHPTVDNQGQPLQTGAWYTNTTNGYWYWRNGANWIVGVGDLNSVDWESQVTNKGKVVTVDTDQAITGKKTFNERLTQRDAATGSQLSVGGTKTLTLSAQNSQWITLCMFGGTNAPLYSRFIFSCPGRHWAAEITFSKTTDGPAGDAWASIRILGAYGYYHAMPYQYRITGFGVNGNSWLEMRLPGGTALTEVYRLTVLEEHQTQDGNYISYPLQYKDSGGQARRVPNALTMGHGTGIYYRYGEIACGATYAPVIEASGAVGQTNLESVP